MFMECASFGIFMSCNKIEPGSMLQMNIMILCKMHNNGIAKAFFRLFCNKVCKNPLTKRVVCIIIFIVCYSRLTYISHYREIIAHKASSARRKIPEGFFGNRRTVLNQRFGREQNTIAQTQL